MSGENSKTSAVRAKQIIYQVRKVTISSYWNTKMSPKKKKRNKLTLASSSYAHEERVETAIIRQFVDNGLKVFSRHHDPSILHSQSQNPKMNERKGKEKRIFVCPESIRSIKGCSKIPPLQFYQCIC